MAARILKRQPDRLQILQGPFVGELVMQAARALKRGTKFSSPLDDKKANTVMFAGVSYICVSISISISIPISISISIPISYNL